MTTIVQWKCIFTYPMYKFYKTIQAVPLQLVVCDDGMDELLCCPAKMRSQGNKSNKMKLIVEKTRYRIFSRSGTEDATRQSVNVKTLEKFKVEAVKLFDHMAGLGEKYFSNA